MKKVICQLGLVIGAMFHGASLSASPFCSLDAVHQQSVNPGEVITGGGWAADPDYGAPVSRVDINVDGQVVVYADLGAERSDVASVFGRSDFLYSGYNFAWNVGNLSPGQHTVTAWAWSAGGVAQLGGSATFTVNGGGGATPSASITGPTSAATGQSITFTISGNCNTGLNEIGLEECDANGGSNVNYGIGSVTGNSASQNFTWPGSSQPGTRYFVGYAWNADRSQLTRSSPFAVTLSATPLEVNISASSTSTQTGQNVNFHVSASAGIGLNEIGLEECDANGGSHVNFGIAAVSGNSASQTFGWSTSTTGTHYFVGYAWNADRSQLLRSSVIAVTVTAAPTFGHINIPASINLTTGGAPYTIGVHYSINDGGVVSGTTTYVENRTVSNMYDPLLSYHVDECQAGPGYVVWVLQEHHGGNGGYTYYYRRLMMARYIRATRSWQVSEIASGTAGGVYTGYLYSYVDYSPVTFNLTLLQWIKATQENNTYNIAHTQGNYNIPTQQL